MKLPFRFSRLTLFSMMALLAVACGSGDTTTSTAGISTSSPETTTTVLLPSTTTTAEPTELEELGYPVSDEYVVETVIRDIDSGTGGLAIDADGTMYQADFGYPGHDGNSVYRISPDGSIETFSQSDEMASLTMITFGADGRLYQSSYGSDRVFVIDEDGNAEIVVEGIRGPTGLVVLEDGTMFVEAYDSSILHRVLPDGTVEDWVSRAPGFNGINGLAMGPDGTLYVSNHRDGGLFAVAPDGTVAELHRFPRATSHVAYQDGSLFVTSRGGFVVFRYDLETGETEIVAGNAEPGDEDGRGAEASFGRPNAITVGPEGALYINHGDGNSNSPVHIRRITHQP